MVNLEMSILHNLEMKNVCYVEVNGNITATEFSKIIKKLRFGLGGKKTYLQKSACSFYPSKHTIWVGFFFHCSSAQLWVEQFVSDRQTQLIDF